MWKLLLPLVLVLAALFAALAADRPLPRADFTIVNSSDISTLDLHRMSWMQDLRVASALYEGLVRNDNFTWGYEKRPAMAESWTCSPDGLTCTFKIRPGTTWSNGEPFTAKDFIRTWRRGLMPDTGAEYLNLYLLFKGGKAFHDWRAAELERFAREGNGASRPEAAQELYTRTRAKFDELVGLSAPDDQTLVIRLEQPVPYFLDLCAFEPMAPIYIPQVESHESIDPITARVRVRSDWTRPPNLVGNGPFVASSWKFKREFRLDKNPRFWNAAAVHLNSISIPVVRDPSAAVLAAQTGSIDWLAEVVPDYQSDMLADKQRYLAEHRSRVDQLKAQGLDPVAIDRRLPADPRQNIHAFPSFGTYFYNFNCSPMLPGGRPNPFADKRVRRAFAMTIDRENIAEAVRRRGEPVAGSLIPPRSLDGYTPPTGLPHDIEAARKLLADAGYPGGKGFPTVEILANADGGHSTIAQAIKRDWEQALGVSVTIIQKELKVFRNDVKNANYMVSRASWFGDYGDPTTFLDINREGDNNNDRKFASAAYEALMDAAAKESDPAARFRLLERAEKLLVEDECALAPIFHYNQVFLFNPHTTSGISPHPRQKQYIWQLDKLGDGVGAENAREMPPKP
ncbi:MAG: peptide ABC transporter substrate-binding protein [Phycisphaerales bacterium]